MTAPRPRAVFLDRDGVLNEAILRDGRPHPPASVEELKIIPGAPLALRRLKDAGFLLIVVSNQPDVARGTQSREAVEAINRAIGDALPIDAFAICWHDDRDQCHCRKPKPGLILEAAARYEIDLKGSYLIGDRWRDIDAGAAAGCRTILIDRHYAEREPAFPPDHRVDGIEEAAERILSVSLRTGSD
jgi:D-glycero-D-manno-heptose 1,7-bisphosphate phosphatase